MPRVSDEFLQKIADGRAGSRCDCPAYWQRRDEARELIAARAAVPLLKLLYDKWEDGDDCYEDPESHYGFLGKAFNLTASQENKILAAINAYDEATK